MAEGIPAASAAVRKSAHATIFISANSTVIDDCRAQGLLRERPQIYTQAVLRNSRSPKHGRPEPDFDAVWRILTIPIPSEPCGRLAGVGYSGRIRQKPGSDWRKNRAVGTLDGFA